MLPTQRTTQEIQTIGFDFPTHPQQINCDIDMLLGHDTFLVDDVALRMSGHECKRAPNYVCNVELVEALLQQFDVNFEVILMHSPKTPKLNTPRCFCVAFQHHGNKFVTSPQRNDNLALSCALWYVLSHLL